MSPAEHRDMILELQGIRFCRKGATLGMDGKKL
jgi:hypothetical protein